MKGVAITAGAIILRWPSYLVIQCKTPKDLHYTITLSHCFADCKIPAGSSRIQQFKSVGDHVIIAMFAAKLLITLFYTELSVTVWVSLRRTFVPINNTKDLKLGRVLLFLWYGFR